MRATGVYAFEMHIKKCRYASFQEGNLLFTLRLGRSSTSIVHSIPSPSNEAEIAANLQLNVDNLALDTQRCSVTITNSNKKMIGIALITLPKDKDFIQNTYRLTQSDDKRAQIDLKLKITPIQSTSMVRGSESKTNIASNKLSEQSSSKLLDSYENRVEYGQSDKALISLNLKSKASQDFPGENQNKRSKSLKIKDVDHLIEVRQSQIKRLKQQKDAYYQLYQIQKSKSQVASKFISLIVKKIQQKCPSIDFNNFSQVSKVTIQSGQHKLNKSASGTQHNAVVQQLQQANRSLHRQVDEYKRIIEQLKGNIKSKSIEKTPVNQNINQVIKSPFNVWDQLKQKASNILPMELTSQEEKNSPFAEVDFKKWLEESVGQREKFQQMLQLLAKKVNEPQKIIPNIRKIKSGIDRAYATLLSKKDLTRESILSHKQDVNRILDEMI